MVNAFADDCVYFTSGLEDVENLSKVLQRWEMDSTMAFAPHKSFSIGVGRRVLAKGEQLIVNNGSFCRIGSEGAPSMASYLGSRLGVNQYDADRESWATTFAKAEARLDYLQKYNFQFPQRVRVLKSLLVSLFTYKTYFMLPTRSEEKRFRSLVLRFLWKEGIARISWDTLQAPVEKGGLGIQGLGELCESFRAALLGRLCENPRVWPCIEGWIQQSLKDQGIQNSELSSLDMETIEVNTWALNGLLSQSRMTGGPQATPIRSDAETILSTKIQHTANMPLINSKFWDFSCKEPHYKSKM